MNESSIDVLFDRHGWTSDECFKLTSMFINKCVSLDIIEQLNNTFDLPQRQTKSLERFGSSFLWHLDKFDGAAELFRVECGDLVLGKVVTKNVDNLVAEVDVKNGRCHGCTDVCYGCRQLFGVSCDGHVESVVRLDRCNVAPHVAKKHGSTDGDYGRTFLGCGKALNFGPLFSKKSTAAVGNDDREDDTVGCTGGVGLGKELECRGYTGFGSRRATWRNCNESICTDKEFVIVNCKNFCFRILLGKLFTQLGSVAGSDSDSAVVPAVALRALMAAKPVSPAFWTIIVMVDIFIKRLVWFFLVCAFVLA